MINKKAVVFAGIILVLFSCALAQAQSYGKGHFYIGGMLNLYNPREELDWLFPTELGYGMGPGITLGLNLTSNISFPDISADMITHLAKDYWTFHDCIVSNQLRIYNVMLGGKYKFGHWRIEPYLRGGVLFQDLRYQEKFNFSDPAFTDTTITNFYWGFAPYIGGGVNYYISPKLYLAIETLYSSGTGSYKSAYEDYHTIRLGGNHINFTLGWLPF
jgi:hypothetical protein